MPRSKESGYPTSYLLSGNTRLSFVPWCASTTGREDWVTTGPDHVFSVVLSEFGVPTLVTTCRDHALLMNIHHVLRLHYGRLILAPELMEVHV